MSSSKIDSSFRVPLANDVSCLLVSGLQQMRFVWLASIMGFAFSCRTPPHTHHFSPEWVPTSCFRSYENRPLLSLN